MSFNWTQLIPLPEQVFHVSQVGHEYSHVATFGIAAVISTTIGIIAKTALGSGEAAIVPVNRFSIRGIFEMLTEFISGLVQSIIGEHGKHFIPFFCSVFFFVLFNNLIGVIPGMTPATENINTTFAMGVFMFVAYNSLGIKENGIVNYLKHFMGPVALLAPFMFIIEMVSHIVRPFSLGLRLANVLGGDHIVLSLFLSLNPFPAPIPFYLMGMFVCFVQAFVFTLLSMVYVAIATAHDH